MAKKRVLVQWIGHSDLRALAAASSASRSKKILEAIRSGPSESGDLGPTKTLLNLQKFDEVRLLTNYTPEINKWFASWAGQSPVMVEVNLQKPTDYEAIYRIVDTELSRLRSRNASDIELCLHLSPGTPAMAATWLLLGKTRYPAVFYETSRDGKAWVSDIPFDLIDIIPEVLRNPDAHLQHLASEAPSEVQGFEDIVGDSRAIRDAVGRAKRAAMRSVSVLLLGESGTGKEMFANAIWKSSPRRDKPFRPVNCAALSKSLLESELFGHKKGSFTGADRDRAGAFEAVDGGTLFLDEVGECDLETQAKLLRVLQPVTEQGASIRKVCRLGEERERTVDVRIIAATNRDLRESIRDGEFREDLYYRLAAVTVTLPPLRDRKTDIPKLAERMLGQLNQQFSLEEPDYEHKAFSATAIAFVKNHHWPGNVRQLYNVLVQAAVFSDGKTLGRKEIAAALGEMPDMSESSSGLSLREIGDGFDLEEHLNSLQRLYLRRAMEESGGVKAKAARLLGMKNYQTLDAQLKRLNVTGDWESKS